MWPLYFNSSSVSFLDPKFMPDDTLDGDAGRFLLDAVSDHSIVCCNFKIEKA